MKCALVIRGASSFDDLRFRTGSATARHNWPKEWAGCVQTQFWHIAELLPPEDLLGRQIAAPVAGRTVAVSFCTRAADAVHQLADREPAAIHMMSEAGNRLAAGDGFRRAWPASPASTS